MHIQRIDATVSKTKPGEADSATLDYWCRRRSRLERCRCDGGGWGHKHMGGNLRFMSMSRVTIAAVRRGGVHCLLGLRLRVSPRQQEHTPVLAVAL